MTCLNRGGGGGGGGGGALWYTYITCQTLRLGRFFSGRLTKVMVSDHAAFRHIWPVDRIKGAILGGGQVQALLV